MRTSDLSVQVSRRKPACVLDPALVLGYAAGPNLALKLTQVFEPWLTRSFWQTLDASELLLRHFERQTPGEAPDGAFIPDPQALMQWVRLREQTDATAWDLHWIDENYAQSQLHDEGDFELFDRYEALAEALAARIAPASLHWPSMDPVLGAIDALALSACLDGAVILTARTSRASEDEPPPVSGLRRAGLAPLRAISEAVPDGGPQGLFEVERRWLRQALVGAGLVTLLQDLPPLNVVHVRASDGAEPAPFDEPGSSDEDPWQGARAWWYCL